MLKYSTILVCVLFVNCPCEIFSNRIDIGEWGPDRCITLLEPLLDRVYDFENRWKTCEANQLASQQEPPKKDTPKNFEKIGSRYFYIEEFYQKNWWAAAKTCRQMGGVLARIQDDKELTAIRRHPKRKHMEHYWLDINDLAEENRFVYSNPDKITPYLKWASTEPNNLNNNEHCVDLYAEHMYDNKCEKKYYYICQAD